MNQWKFISDGFSSLIISSGGKKIAGKKPIHSSQYHTSYIPFFFILLDENFSYYFKQVSLLSVSTLWPWIMTTGSLLFSLRLKAQPSQLWKCISSWCSNLHLSLSVIYLDAKRTSFLGYLFLIDEVGTHKPAAVTESKRCLAADSLYINWPGFFRFKKSLVWSQQHLLLRKTMAAQCQHASLLKSRIPINAISQYKTHEGKFKCDKTWLR